VFDCDMAAGALTVLQLLYPQLLDNTKRWQEIDKVLVYIRYIYIYVFINIRYITVPARKICCNPE